jgi:hypothetical protein
VMIAWARPDSRSEDCSQHPNGLPTGRSSGALVLVDVFGSRTGQGQLRVGRETPADRLMKCGMTTRAMATWTAWASSEFVPASG